MKELTERLKNIKQNADYKHTMDTYCSIDFEKDLPKDCSQYSIDTICTKEKGYIFYYDNKFYILADVYFLLFGGYSTGMFDTKAIKELNIRYPYVAYKLLKYSDKKFPTPFISIDKKTFLKLRKKYNRLNEEAFDKFNDKYLQSMSILCDENYIETLKKAEENNQVTVNNPTIANLNEVVEEIKSNYKGFIAEEAIDKIADYIAQNIIVFVEDKEDKKQQDEIDRLSNQVDVLKEENEELLKENRRVRKLNNEMKSAMCHIANQVSPFIRKMNDTELIMRSLFSGNITEDTDFGEPRKNDTEPEENNIKPKENNVELKENNIKPKENEAIKFDYSKLKAFVDKMRNGVGNEMSKKWNLPIRNVIHRFTQEACGSYYHVTYEDAIKTNMKNGSCVYSITDELLAMFFLKNIKESNFDYSKDNAGNNIYSDFIVKDENFNDSDISKGLMKESQYLAILSNNLTEVFTGLKPSEIQEKDIDYLYNYCEVHLYDRYGGHRPVCVDIKPEYR